MSGEPQLTFFEINQMLHELQSKLAEIFSSPEKSLEDKTHVFFIFILKH